MSKRFVQIFLLVGVFLAFGFLIKVEAQNKSSEIFDPAQKKSQKNTLPLDPQKIPQIDVENKTVKRSPGFSPLELELERLQDGRLRVKSVDPEGPFGGVVEQNQIFNSFEEIPRPKADH